MVHIDAVDAVAVAIVEVQHVSGGCAVRGFAAGVGFDVASVVVGKAAVAQWHRCAAGGAGARHV